MKSTAYPQSNNITEIILFNLQKIRFYVSMYRQSWVDVSSVARGGEAGRAIAPIGLKSMQNTSFVALLRPIFALKTKIAPPLALAMRIGQGPDVISTKKTGLQPG